MAMFPPWPDLPGFEPHFDVINTSSSINWEDFYQTMGQPGHDAIVHVSVLIMFLVIKS